MFKRKSLALALLPVSFMAAEVDAKQASHLVSIPSPGSALVTNAAFIKPVAAQEQLNFIGLTH